MNTPDNSADMWSYKGWSISYDAKPIPSRAFDWCATSPDYDVDCDQDGFHKCGGEIVHAATYEELLQEIEDCLAGEGRMTLRHHRAIMRSIDAERTEYDGWAPNGRAVRQARAHLASMTPERRAELEREWK